MNELLEAAGAALIAAFGYCIWPPVALLVIGIALILKALVDDQDAPDSSGTK